MKYWIQFLNSSSVPVETHPVDGRLSQDGMIERARYRAYQLETVRTFAAFRLCAGRSFGTAERSAGPFPLKYPIRY